MKIPISDDVRRFILGNIPSVPHLEALLLLRSRSNYKWPLSEVAQRLFISEQTAEEILNHLQVIGLVMESYEDSTCYQYKTLNMLNDLITQLAAVYSSNLIEVTNLIHCNTDQKAQKFANAFIWKK